MSTFAGCGGSSLGYTLAGGKVRLAVEWDDNAVETYRLNFPDTPIYHGDIAKLSVDECLRLSGLKVGELDIFDGSPPCQGFSTAGRRKLDDSRNQLFREYVRLLQGLQPRAFVMENVAGMVKGKMRLVFVECLRALKKSGYRVRARLLNAMYFNVPQSRERMIFIGVRDDLEIDPSHPLPQSTPMTVREALRGVVNDPDERQWLLECGERYAAYAPYDTMRQGENGRFGDFYRMNPHTPARTIVKFAGVVGARSVMHFDEKRRPTVSEFKRLASFPDKYTFVGEWKDKVERIGNSVPPRFMQAIAEHVAYNVLGVIRKGQHE